MRQARWARTGLRDRLRSAFLAVGLVGIIGMGFVGYTFSQLIDARERLADQLDPAGVQTRRWVASVVDQESGIRGFALTGDESFLEPYEAGLPTAAEAEAEARRLLADERDLLDLADEFTQRSDRWRTEAAEPLLADLRGDADDDAIDADLRRSKSSFDQLRAAYRAFQDALDETRAEARRDLDDHTTALARAAAVAVLLAAAGLAATWVALNRWVIAPVAALASDARRVASGELRHEISVEGPRDLEDLGSDVEAMRQRILWELAQVEENQERLEEQAADLTRSNQELEQFAYVASHDLQEPLRKITGFCQLLQRRYGGQLDERADEYIAFAVDGAKRMQTLINDLLSFSRVGRTTETFQQVDLNPVAASAVATLQEAIADAGATVEVDRLPT
ncbi:MAG TPA: CHASE3 domain-containing protein, partial [Aquihabitans sp.]|nr:CHASE3 domain-containing protein [Aquihabitans sp.]